MHSSPVFQFLVKPSILNSFDGKEEIQKSISKKHISCIAVLGIYSK
jgi:hypothetical protein